MALNWIKVEEFSFNSFLLMERFQIRYICDKVLEYDDLRMNMDLALRHSPSVYWYFAHKCPECRTKLDQIISDIPVNTAQDVRTAEISVMRAFEDFVIYGYPELMDTSCDFIYNWDQQRLYELVDFSDQTVLDVGSGSGRLAFAAAQKARHIYASEPVDMLREYMRDKIKRQGIRNMTVVDGMVDSIPYPDNTFDIVMSGHVVGDNPDEEIAELARVTKNGGWILDCPGDDDCKRQPNQDLIHRGWEEFHYVSKSGGDIYRYRKQILKE